MLAEVSDAQTEVFAFDFDGRDDLVSASDALADALLLAMLAARRIERFALPTGASPATIADPLPDLNELMDLVRKQPRGTPGPIATAVEIELEAVLKSKEIPTPGEGRRK